MASPIIWANSKFSKLLSSVGLMAKNGYQTLFVDVDPRTTATDANRGDTLLSKYGIFQKDDSGSTTNWTRYADQQLYKVYDNFESNNGNGFTDPKWIAYGNTNSALSYPDDFGGTAGPTAGTTTSNTDLSGNFVLRLGVSSSMNGKGTYRAFSISNGEKGLPFIFETQVKITKLGSAEWASNAQIWIVGSNDNFVSNFQNIPLTNYVVSKSGLLKGSFIDSSATLTNFRLCIHFSGLTDTFNVDFDEVKIYSGAQDTLSSIVSEWFSYTPTFQGFGTVTNINIKYRQVGSNYEFLGAFNSGTPSGSGVYGFTLPNGSTISSGINDDSMFGSVAFSQVFANGQNTFLGGRRGESYINLYINSTTTGYTRVSTNGPLPTSGATYYIQATVPIQGLNQFGSNVIASSENFMPIKANSASGQAIANTTYVEVDFSNYSNDTRFITNSRFTLPVNGTFLLNTRLEIGGVSTLVVVEIRKNGVAVGSGQLHQERPASAAGSHAWTFRIDTTGNLSTDYYSVWAYQNSGSSQTLTGGNCYLNIDRLDKPFSMNLFQAGGMVLSPTDNVLPAQFSRSTTQSIPNATTTTIIWDTINFNPSNAISLNTSTGRMTNNGPSGYYKFSGMIRSASYSGASTMVGAITRSVNSGTPVEIGFSGSSSGTTYMGLPFETTVFLSTGSYIDIIVYQETGATNSFSIRNLDVQRVDKTAVSAGGGYTKWQKKELLSSFSGTGTVTGMSFSNLEIGKTYKVKGYIRITSGANAVMEGDYVCNSLKVAGFYSGGGTGSNMYYNFDGIFTAGATSLTLTMSSNGNGVYGSSDPNNRSWATLEELPQHIQTNQWT